MPLSTNPLISQVISQASALRQELSGRNQAFALVHELPHHVSYGETPVVLYEPVESAGSGRGDQDGARHGNFLPESYRAILAEPSWARRLTKAHTAKRSLPRNDRGFWSELDSSTSSDALLMNVFCHPATLRDPRVCSMLGVPGDARPEFGTKARVPLLDGKFDRTEVDMCLGPLLVEAKLTENDFQTAPAALVERYCDFHDVFDVAALPIFVPPSRPVAHCEDFSQLPIGDSLTDGVLPEVAPTTTVEPRFQSYQLIRNVLAAHATGSAFCVLLDARRPDLQEAWFRIMSCVRYYELRTRCQVLTWQELAALLPQQLQSFLEEKYGIIPSGR